MLSSLINFLWNLFLAAPWWGEILIVVILFWVGFFVLAILLLLIYDLMLIFGMPAMFLLYIISGILSIFIRICKALGLTSKMLETIKQKLLDAEKKYDKVMSGDNEKT